MIPIVQTSLVGTERVSVVSWEDEWDNKTVLGYQITSQTLRMKSQKQVVDNVISSIITGRLTDKQPFLWSPDQDSSSISSVGQYIKNSTSFGTVPSNLFIATFPVGTDTGVLRDLALRLNMSISCDLVSQSDFPSPCPGPSPLDQTFTNINTSTSTGFVGSLPRYRARVCAPGNISSSPWNDTAYRQDISEELWLDYQRSSSFSERISGIVDQGRNYTLHCYGNSRLGYFELPNYWNGHVSGPLLDKGPPVARI